MLHPPQPTSLFYPPDLIKVLYSLIFLLMRSWLVKTAFYIKREEGRKDRNNEQQYVMLQGSGASAAETQLVALYITCKY